MSLQKNAAGSTKPTKGTSRIPTSGRDSGTHSRSSSVSNLTSASDLQSEMGDISLDVSYDFKLNEKVWVNGSKPGVLKFLGKTQFAPGVWAGVLLDDPVGKNDGCVSGVRYFQCAPERGIFARPQKLTRTPGTPTMSVGDTPISPRPVPSGIRGICSKLKVGDRVAVNSTFGVKSGLLRYLGETEFARGDWAGVELDEPLGKNDGSVAGKRYFQCEMKYGLFAPVHKVSRAGGTTTPRSGIARNTPLSSRSTFGSRESLNSTISNASRTSRVKLGITSLTGSQKSLKSPTVNTATQALEATLKEKEQHIEQLLKERDLEREEVAKAATQYEEVQKKLAESEEKFSQVRKLYESAESKRKDAENQMADNQKKLEDLEFKVEEELVNKGELSIQLQQRNMIVKRIEDFALQELGEKSINIQEIIKGQEYLTSVDAKCVAPAEIEMLQKKIVQLEATLDAVGTEKGKYEDEIYALQKNLDEAAYQTQQKDRAWHTTLDEKEKQLASMQGEVEKMALTTKETDDRIVKLEMEVDKARGEANASAIALQEEKKALQKKIEDMTRIREDQCKILTEKQSKISTLNNSLEVEAIEKAKLQSSINDLNRQLQSMETEKGSLQSMLEEQMGILKDKFASELSQKDEKVAQLSSQLEKFTGELETQNLRASQLDVQVTTLRNTLVEKEAELMVKCEKTLQLSSELKKFTDELEAQKLQFSQLEMQMTTLQNTLAMTETGLKEECEAQEKLEAEFAALCKEKEAKETLLADEVRAVNDRLEKTVQSNEEVVLQLKKDVQSLREEADKKTTAHSTLEKKAQEVQNNLEARQSEIAELNEKLSHAEHKIEVLSRDSSEHVRLLQDELTKLQEERLSEKMQLEKELENVKKQYDDAALALTETEKIANKNEQALGALQKEITLKDGDLSKLSSTVQNLSEQVAGLENQKTTSKESHERELASIKDSHADELKQKNQEFEDLNKERASHKETIERLTHEINQRENEIVGYNSSISEKEAQREKVQKELECARNELLLLRQQNEENLAQFTNKELHLNNLKSEQEKQSQQKQQELQDEIARLKATIVMGEGETTQREDKIQELTSRVEESRKSNEMLTAELEKLKEEKDGLLQNGEQHTRTLQNRVDELEVKYNQLEVEKQEIALKEVAANAVKEELEKKCKALLQEKAEQQDLVQERDGRVQTLQAEVVQMQAQFAQHKLELEQKLDLSQKEIEAGLELRQQIEIQHTAAKTLREELSKSEDARTKLVSELDRLSEEKLQLEKNLSEFGKTGEEKVARMCEMEKEMAEIAALLQKNKLALDAKDADLNILNEQVRDLQKNATLLKEVQSESKQLELENRKLKEQAEKTPAKPVSTTAAEEEIESLKSQVNFLNSIIVELKQKQEETSEKLEQQKTLWEQTDLNLNQSKTEAAPRLFCDICDRFDVHDTEDCPKQESYYEGSPSPQPKAKSKKYEERPYCNMCEMFDHWTDECTEQETF